MAQWCECLRLFVTAEEREATLTMRVDAPGGKTMTMKYTGKRLGDCAK
mgnify:CR=1 FL=1